MIQTLGLSDTAGDLLSALLLAWLHRAPDDLQCAVETAVSSLQVCFRSHAVCMCA